MLKYCLRKWNENKGFLEECLKTNSSLNSCDYIDLVRLVVDFVLNPGEDDYERWDSRHITVVDNGDYQGTQLFLIPRDGYQPSEYDYLMTYTGYGSCSGCDTLLSIQGHSDGLLTPRQVKDYMGLCKDLLTNMIKPYNCGWRLEDEFTEVTMSK